MIWSNQSKNQTFLFVLSLFLVERYDPKTNKWSAVAPMTTRRKHLGCAVYNGYICKTCSSENHSIDLVLILNFSGIDAVGGRDDATELSTAERYNPKTNQWTPVVAMNSRRSGVRFINWVILSSHPSSSGWFSRG